MKMNPPRIATTDTRRVQPQPRRQAGDHLGSEAHRQWAKAVLARAGGYCEAPGCGQRARYADHIKERRDFPELALSIDNGQALCPRHHALKTYQARGKRMGLT